MKRILIILICVLSALLTYAQTVTNTDSVQTARLPEAVSKEPGIGISGSLKLSRYPYDAGLWVMTSERVYGMIKFSSSVPWSVSGRDGVVYTREFINVRPGVALSSRKYKRTMLVSSLHVDVLRISHRLEERVQDPFSGNQIRTNIRDVTYMGGLGYEFNGLTMFKHFFINYGVSTGLRVFGQQPFERQTDVIVEGTIEEFPLYFHLFGGVGVFINQ